jgi:hypothetical protein
MQRELTSASNLSRRELCPGSAAAESVFPESKDSEASSEGTLLHLIDAGEESNTPLSGEQREVLIAASRGDEEIFRSVCASAEISEDEPYEEGREAEMWFNRGLKRLFPGHCDRWRLYPRLQLLVIIDKKFGRLEVTDADANMQLRAYAVAGAKKWRAQDVYVAINQPRLKFGERISIGHYTAEQLTAAAQHITQIWDGAHNTDGSPRQDVPRVAGEEQCRYCRAKIHCDAYREQFACLVPPADTQHEKFVAKLTALSDAGLDQVQRAVNFAGAIKDEVKVEILKRMEHGGMTNYTLKNTGNTSKIRDVGPAVALLEGIGFSQMDILRRSTISLDKLSEELQAREGGTAIASKRKIKDTLEPVLDTIPKAQSLKRVGNLLE